VSPAGLVDPLAVQLLPVCRSIPKCPVLDLDLLMTMMMMMMEMLLIMVAVHQKTLDLVQHDSRSRLMILLSNAILLERLLLQNHMIWHGLHPVV